MKITQIPVTSKPAALEWIRAHNLTGLGILQLFHDDDCPSIASQRDADCTCLPDCYLVEPFVASAAQESAVLN